MQIPQEQTREWWREIAIQIVRDKGAALTPEELCHVNQTLAWEWCFATFGTGVPVTMGLAMDVQLVAQMVGAQMTWGRELAEKVGRI